MAGCGYLPDAIDAMAMADVIALTRHWRACPPAHELIAAVLGLGSAGPAGAAGPLDPADPSNIGALIARHPSGYR